MKSKQNRKSTAYWDLHMPKILDLICKNYKIREIAPMFDTNPAALNILLWGRGISVVRVRHEYRMGCLK